jgi:hypothetical protein
MKYDWELSPGPRLSSATIGACIAVIREGCAVDVRRAKIHLPKARMVAVGRMSLIVVAVGAIKEARPKYAAEIAKRSGYDFEPEMLELGYVARLISQQGHKLSEKIVAQLLRAIPDVALFATTSNETMKRTLKGAGFSQRGTEWPGRKAVRLTLWIRGSD